MGTGPSVHADVDSPTMPGMKSCVSDPLDEYCDDIDAFFDELLAMMKEPVSLGEVAVLKKVELNEQGSEECTVRVVLDGEKLLSYGFGSSASPDGEDVTRIWQRLMWSRDKRYIEAQNYDPADGITEHDRWRINLLSDPFRLEVVILKDFAGVGTKVVAWIMEEAWIKPILSIIKGRRVKIKRNVSSPFGGGMSAVSEPLDRHIDFDALFEAVLRRIRLLGGHDSQVIDISDSEFEATASTEVFGGGIGPGFPNQALKYSVKHDRTSGEVVLVVSIGNHLLYTHFFVLHKDPLLLETWVEQDGRRHAPKFTGDHLQILADSAIQGEEGADACAIL